MSRATEDKPGWVYGPEPEDPLREKLADLKFNDEPGLIGTLGANLEPEVFASILALLHSAEAESYRRGQIDEFEKVFGTNGLVGDWANVPTEWVRKRRAELATSAQDDGGESHEHVWSNMLLMSNPPQRKCTICGHTEFV